MEELGIHRFVGIPPDIVFSIGIADGVFVFWSSSGVLSGFGHEGTFIAEYAFSTFDCVFNEVGGGKVFMNGRSSGEI